MALGEVFLAAFLQLLLDRMTPREILEYLGNFRGVGQKLEKWRTTLSTIGAVLSDAEERQLTEGGVKLWLDDLRYLAYDIEDMLDKFAVKMLKRMIEGRDQASTSRKVRRSFYKVKLSFDMNSEMKKITKRLQDISERKDKFGLKDIGTSAKESRSLPSSDVLDEKLVVGRDGDKGEIIELLSKKYEHADAVNFGVVAIVGMPGVGKTTLAQLVFNRKDDAMKEFELKVWVCVSDDFDVERVTKAILESITSRPVQVQEFSKIQHDLSEQLRGKKFLIVLDDIWNKDDSDLYDLWTRLQSPFGIGAGGSKIIVTTRDVNVAKIMGATGVHNLECMADDDCLEIFERHAFRRINNGKPVNYDLIKTRIVEKCRGLPLAARTLGGLLRCKEKDEWGEILNNKLWNLADKSGILPVLKLSYHYLPSNLKRCFAYCSILPNDYEFGEKQLILLWMAEGLSKVRYLKINGCEKLTSSLKNEARLLQRLTSLGRLEIKDNSRLVEELGEEAEELLQLQILDCKLEFLELENCENLLKLPKGLNQLSSLQELRIHECSSLVSFPDVGLPPSLKDIDIRSCDSLIYFAKFQIPQNLRRIYIRDCKSLKSLVDEEECERLGLIAPNGFFSDNTNHCLEDISIFNCQNLKSLLDGLCHLSNLQTVRIEYCGSLVSIPRLSGGRRPSNLRKIIIRDCEKLEALPEDMHNLNSLEHLSIDYREGLTFPPNLTSLVIRNVKSCKSLWELEWGLHRLTYLEIGGEDPDTVSFPPDMVRMEMLFPKSLTHLYINGFPNLKKLSSKGFQFLTSLQSLVLSNCPKLASIPEEGLPPSLEELFIHGCPVLKERCQPGKGRYSHKISHIPRIQIDWQPI